MAEIETLATREELLAKIEQLEAEQRKFRADVVRVAKRESNKHGWCSVVDNALDEIGLSPKWKTLEVEMTVPVKIVFQIDENIHTELTQETVNEIASKVFMVNPRFDGGGVRMTAGHNSQLNGDATATSAVERGDSTQHGQFRLADGYMGVFTSNEGRVRHILRGANIDDLRRDRRNEPLCGRVDYYSRDNWTSTSNRDEGRYCSSCVERAERTGGIILPNEEPEPPRSIFAIVA